MSFNLDKPIESWLKDIDFPKLYKKETGIALTEKEVHFLFYRMSRMKDISIDAEALEILQLIDTSKSNDFAFALLKVFLENGAEAKHKWCLTLSSLLGDDKIVEALKKNATGWIDNARPKMAEYVVNALLLNASAKALRILEYFSRKYKTKNIGKTAALGFKSVAEYLGISENELSDSLIPDFNFEGLFKIFEVKGEQYRAFIDNDFKLAFLNEDNTALKTLPKGTPEILKAEFKEVSKEIKEVVKAQTPRLESSLVSQRFWTSEDFQELFLQNPIMFVFAVRLIWGIFDEKNELQNTFAVQEDQTIIDPAGDEISLEENSKIGIVHPLSLTDEILNHWKNFLLDVALTPIFPQLERKIFELKIADKNLKISKNYYGIKVNAFTFIGTLDKKGWSRGSVVDAGVIDSYYKKFPEAGITAIIEQIGALSVSYFENPAELGDLIFIKKDVKKFSNQLYNEPNNENDPRLIPFSELPPIIYSEVISDLEILKTSATV